MMRSLLALFVLSSAAWISSSSQVLAGWPFRHHHHHHHFYGYSSYRPYLSFYRPYAYRSYYYRPYVYGSYYRSSYYTTRFYSPFPNCVSFPSYTSYYGCGWATPTTYYYSPATSIRTVTYDPCWTVTYNDPSSWNTIEISSISNRLPIDRLVDFRNLTPAATSDRVEDEVFDENRPLPIDRFDPIDRLDQIDQLADDRLQSGMPVSTLVPTSSDWAESAIGISDLMIQEGDSKAALDACERMSEIRLQLPASIYLRHVILATVHGADSNRLTSLMLQAWQNGGDFHASGLPGRSVRAYLAGDTKVDFDASLNRLAEKALKSESAEDLLALAILMRIDQQSDKASLFLESALKRGLAPELFEMAQQL